jgi:WD40 repeat protein
MRLLQDLRNYSPIKAFNPRCESVRDLVFIGNKPLFACAYENGAVVLWDIRQTSRYLQRLAAHNGICLSLAANGSYLATGGRDKLLKALISFR